MSLAWPHTMYKPPTVSALRTPRCTASVWKRVAAPRCRPYSASARAPQKPAEPQPQVDGRKLTPQEAKLEAAKLAVSSLKEVGSLFSSGSDDAVQPIDTAPVFANPYVFGALNVVHQGQVARELQDKYDGNWAKMTAQDKRLGYYVAYGNWGVRERFDQWASPEAPWDLPFTVPSRVRTAHPVPTDKVHRLEPVFLAETPVRKAQFDTKKTDPVTKTFLYITAFVVVFALARDKKVGEEGRPVECIAVDRFAEQRQEARKALEAQREEAAQREAALASARARKWYYLWLK